MPWELDKPKFKVGDLVKVVEEIDFLACDAVVKPGEIGLVISVDTTDEGYVNYWGFDYMVLIRGRLKLLFFESEIQLYERAIDNPMKDKLNFIFLKH